MDDGSAGQWVNTGQEGIANGQEVATRLTGQVHAGAYPRVHEHIGAVLHIQVKPIKEVAMPDGQRGLQGPGCGAQTGRCRRRRHGDTKAGQGGIPPRPQPAAVTLGRRQKGAHRRLVIAFQKPPDDSIESDPDLTSYRQTTQKVEHPPAFRTAVDIIAQEHGDGAQTAGLRPRSIDP